MTSILLRLLSLLASETSRMKTNSWLDRSEKFVMLGLSGGGWSTTLASAVDPRIQLSFPTAGSIPFDLKVGACKSSADDVLRFDLSTRQHTRQSSVQNLVG